MSVINDSPASGSLRYLSDKMFLPFELNDSDHQYGNDNIDPDLNYFRSFNQYISCCNYFVESSLNSEIDKCLNMKQRFSMCHLNIRSLRKNVGSFEILLDGLQHKVSLLGVTETWLKDDDCNLYDIEGYNKLNKHRQNRSDGGIVIFLKGSIEYTIRNDLITFNEHIESAFVEISKEHMNAKKILSLELFIEFQIQIWRTLMKRWQMHWNNCVWKVIWCT